LKLKRKSKKLMRPPLKMSVKRDFLLILSRWLWITVSVIENKLFWHWKSLVEIRSQQFLRYQVERNIQKFLPYQKKKRTLITFFIVKIFQRYLLI